MTQKTPEMKEGQIHHIDRGAARDIQGALVDTCKTGNAIQEVETGIDASICRATAFVASIDRCFLSPFRPLGVVVYYPR